MNNTTQPTKKFDVFYALADYGDFSVEATDYEQAHDLAMERINKLVADYEKSTNTVFGELLELIESDGEEEVCTN